MIDHIYRFMNLVAWFVLVVATIRTGLIFYYEATYPKSARFFLDQIHGIKRSFTVAPTLVWAILAAVWLYAGGQP